MKDLPEGQTHSQNDGCGEPAHNIMNNENNHECGTIIHASDGSRCANDGALPKAFDDFTKRFISLAYRRGAEDMGKAIDEVKLKDRSDQDTKHAEASYWDAGYNTAIQDIQERKEQFLRRPLKFKTLEELASKCRAYFRSCDSKKKP